MPISGSDDWSPADSPYAIAASEAQWWWSAINLAVARLGDRADPRSAPMGSHQVDARYLILALAQLLTAENLEQVALSELEIDARVRQDLAAARGTYLHLLPGIQEMRNALTHFDEWARGHGHGPQKRFVHEGADKRSAAREFWGFGYDPSSQVVRHGPHCIEVPTASRAAAGLAQAIYAAAREVDQRLPESD